MSIMPRTAGVSSSSRTDPTRRRPSPATHARCLGSRPEVDFTSLIFTDFFATLSSLTYPIGPYPRYAVISSTVLPRFAATIWGDFMRVRARNVAVTTFTGLVEP